MLRDGEAISRLRSVAYGYSVERMLAYAYLSTDLAEGEQLVVETLEGPVVATVVADRLVDPSGSRLQ